MKDKELHKLKQRARAQLNRNEVAAAARSYSELCSHAPDSESHTGMGVTLLRQSMYQQAEQHLKEAIRLDAGNATAWHQAGIARASQRDFGNALQLIRKSVEIHPGSKAAWNDLGNLYREIGQVASAEHCFLKALDIDHKDPEVHNNLANIYLSRCDYTAADKHYRTAIKLDRGYFEPAYNLGAVYQNLGDHDKAIKQYRKARTLRPGDIQADIAIANSFEKQGEYDKAMELIDPLLRRGISSPEIADIYGKICISRNDYEAGESVIRQSLQNPGSPIFEQALRFSLGDILDKQKRYDEAFQQYRQANSMRPYHYDRQMTADWFGSIRSVFDSLDPAPTASAGPPAPRPVFIVGMPRSGTTLVEQIISSHSDVHGAGELPYMAELANRHVDIDGKRSSYPHSVTALDSGNLDELLSEYIRKLDQHGPRSSVKTDKMPHNFLYIGLLQMMYPGCRIIHCLRDPLDVCLSIYFHNFNQNHPYTDRLDNLAHYYNLYRELMTYWNDRYCNEIMNVQYESLLDAPDKSVAAILDHIGLEWEDSCLHYYEQKRTISTPSYAQASTPMYTTSRQRWLNYTDHIDELHDNISAEYLLDH